MKELFPIYRTTTMLNIVGPFRIPAAMHVIKDGDEVIVIDPFLLPELETKELLKLGNPTLILIGGELHVRDAEAYRKRYGAKILAHREAAPEIKIAVDDTFCDDETSPGGLTTIGMPGCTAGETIFRREQGKGVLIVSDALFNLQLIRDCGLIFGSIMRLVEFPEGLGPMSKLFMSDEKLAAQSYRKLLDYDFEQILVSHGRPILKGAKGKLEIALDQW